MQLICQFLIDTFKTKTEGWKIKILSIRKKTKIECWEMKNQGKEKKKKNCQTCQKGYFLSLSFNVSRNWFLIQCWLQNKLPHEGDTLSFPWPWAEFPCFIPTVWGKYPLHRLLCSLFCVILSPKQVRRRNLCKGQILHWSYNLLVIEIAVSLLQPGSNQNLFPAQSVAPPPKIR